MQLTPQETGTEEEGEPMTGNLGHEVWRIEEYTNRRNFDSSGILPEFDKIVVKIRNSLIVVKIRNSL